MNDLGLKDASCTVIYSTECGASVHFSALEPGAHRAGEAYLLESTCVTAKCKPGGVSTLTF